MKNRIFPVLLVLVPLLLGCGGRAGSPPASTVPETTVPTQTAAAAEAGEVAAPVAEIKMPAKMTAMPAGFSSYMKSLVRVVFPENSLMTELTNGAFKGCSKLEEITLPARLVTIGDSAFSGCSKLTGLTLPASLTSIGSDAFNQCVSLKNIQIVKLLLQMVDSLFTTSF